MKWKLFLISTVVVIFDLRGPTAQTKDRHLAHTLTALRLPTVRRHQRIRLRCSGHFPRLTVPLNAFRRTMPPTIAMLMLSKVPIRKYSANRPGDLSSG